MLRSLSFPLRTVHRGTLVGLWLALGGPSGCGYLGLDRAPTEGAGAAGQVVTGGQPAGGGSPPHGDGRGGGFGGLGGANLGGEHRGGEAGAVPSGGVEGASCDSLCRELFEAIAHRYSFSEKGSTAVDRVGDRPARIDGAVLDGSGSVELTGGGAHVEIPYSVRSNELTLELWFSWRGGPPRQTLLAVGGQGEPQPDSPYLYVAPARGASAGSNGAFVAAGRGAGRELRASSEADLPLDDEVHVAVVVSATRELVFYVEGARVATIPLDFELSEMVSDVLYLGRSLFENDPGLSASISEFRIYETALSEELVARSWAMGPDAGP